MRRGWPPLVRVFALAGLLPLVAGCRLDAVVEVTLGRDGGGTFVVDLTADRELLTRAAASGAEPLTSLAEEVDALPGWDAELTPSGEGGRSVRLAADFAGEDEFNALAERFAEALNAPELAPLEALRLEARGDHVIVSGTAALRPAPPVAELGFTPEQATAGLAEAVTYRLTVRLPGEVVDTNADVAQDGTLTWQVPAGQRVEVLAEGTLPGLPVAPLLGAGALAAGVTAWWLRRRDAA